MQCVAPQTLNRAEGELHAAFRPRGSRFIQFLGPTVRSRLEDRHARDLRSVRRVPMFLTVFFSLSSLRSFRKYFVPYEPLSRPLLILLITVVYNHTCLPSPCISSYVVYRRYINYRLKFLSSNSKDPWSSGKTFAH
jgi:hypothetical protein